LVEYARMRYNLLGQGGHWFPGRPMGNLTPEEILPALVRCPNPQKTLSHLLAARDLLQGEKVERLSKST
jgi:predicted aldo/keto reductase-like oxidoreductase